jgi:hypothetical protein
MSRTRWHLSGLALILSAIAPPLDSERSRSRVIPGPQ